MEVKKNVIVIYMKNGRVVSRPKYKKDKKIYDRKKSKKVQD